MESSRVFLLLIGICYITLVRHADAECCYSKLLKCEDGTRTRAFCGRGRCNIFGCSCIGGCRTKRSFMERSSDYKIDINNLTMVTTN